MRSLYTLPVPHWIGKRYIDVSVSDGVFCLAGANGIGKSTFLAALNFGLTGVVADANSKFESVREFYDKSLKYSKNFFSGRISESDRELAEVIIEFFIGNHKYKIKRGLFDTQELRDLEISNADSEIFNNKPLRSNPQLHEEYTKFLVKDIGIDSFEQFVFLQHFILTFDETRRLLFYDQRVLERTLYLTFGLEPSVVRRVDQLKRDIEREDSRSRNAKYQASQLKKKIQVLNEALQHESNSNGFDYSNLETEYKTIVEAVEEKGKVVERLEDEIRDINIRRIDLFSKQSELQLSYKQEFSLHIQQHTNLLQHPIASQSFSSHSCALCGAQGESVIENIKLKLEATICPLCSTSIEHTNSQEGNLENLLSIDLELERIKEELDACSLAWQRLSSELRQSQEELGSVREKLAIFEQENEEAVKASFRNPEQTSDLSSMLDSFQKTMRQFDKDSRNFRKRRDERSQELRECERDLQNRYAAAELDFVPLFRDLATQFLGLDIMISLESAGAEGLKLILSVDSEKRRAEYQLSESQRFFIDIALRMAIAQYLSSPSSKATLFIDTPEGSLDIAYESRAGDMFASFVEQGFHIIMTANINSSQLLKKLASRCGESQMHIRKMTSWRELSDVQKEEEGLFEAAFKRIDEALKTGNVQPS